MPDIVDTPPLTATLAGFAVETKGDAIPAAATEAAKTLILDTVGVALAASQRPIGRIVAGYVAEPCGGPKSATVLGLGLKVPPETAAFANGTLANALDFDEGSHLSTHILPAALAVCEARRLSGRDLVDAFAIGYEVGARLTQTIDAKRRQQGGPTHRGWWHVGLVGPIAAALTVSRLLKLDSRQAATAMGIASCSSGGFRRNMGTMAKALHSGNAARAGLEAAALAARGFTADPAILEAPLGFLQAVCPPEERDEAAITTRLGRPYALEGTLRIKAFPACNPGHPLIDAAIRLKSEHGVASEEIEGIDADLHTFSLLRLAPEDEDEAGFSGAFLLAATLVHGAFGLEQLSESRLHAPRVQGLMKRIRHVPAGEPETVAVRLKDGRTVTVEVRPVRRLGTRDAVVEKFRRCAAAALVPEAVNALEEAILRVAMEPDVARLTAAASRAAALA